jgi:ribosomal protein L40E
MMARHRKPSHDDFICPNCGAELPGGAEFCRACGASDDSGWDDAPEPRADLPEGYGPDDDDFDYDEFVRREFGAGASEWSKRDLQRLIWAVVVLVVGAAFLTMVLR